MATEHESELKKPVPAIERLLFIADSAVADANDLPPSLRALIDTAAELYVVPPTLTGRLAWLADDVDGFRHVADERLDTVLRRMRSIAASPRCTAAALPSSASSVASSTNGRSPRCGSVDWIVSGCTPT